MFRVGIHDVFWRRPMLERWIETLGKHDALGP
jgi:hypothetical protein